MEKTFRLELRDGDLFIDGYPKTEGEFIALIKEALNHQIVFQNSQKISFCVRKEFGKWTVEFPASAPCSIIYLFSYVKRNLEEHGPVATLHQNTFWIDKK